MKQIFYLALVFAAVLAVALGASHLPHAGVGLAMMAPLMPSLMGRRLVDRAIKLNDGTFGPGLQWLHDVVYDRLILGSTLPLQTSLFRNKAGDIRNGVTLSLADTNVVSPQVPTGQRWTLWTLKVRYQGLTAQTDAKIQLMLNFFRTTQINLVITNLATMFTMPLSYFLGGEQFVSAPAVTVNSRFPQGQSSEVWEMKVPIVLQENATWSLDINQLAASDAALDGNYILFAFDREMYRIGG